MYPVEGLNFGRIFVALFVNGSDVSPAMMEKWMWNSLVPVYWSVAVSERLPIWREGWYQSYINSWGSFISNDRLQKDSAMNQTMTHGWWKGGGGSCTYTRSVTFISTKQRFLDYRQFKITREMRYLLINNFHFNTYYLIYLKVKS